MCGDFFSQIQILNHPHKNYFSADSDVNRCPGKFFCNKTFYNISGKELHRFWATNIMNKHYLPTADPLSPVLFMFSLHCMWKAEVSNICMNCKDWHGFFVLFKDTEKDMTGYKCMVKLFVRWWVFKQRRHKNPVFSGLHCIQDKGFFAFSLVQKSRSLHAIMGLYFTVI